MSKIAVFGGTFDPVHNGHIAMAKYSSEHFGFEKVVFLPNGNPPHKKELVVTSALHRYNMVKLAVCGFDKFAVSDYEIKRRQYSYSLYTMRYFRGKYGKDVWFIIGADSLCTIHKWYEYQKLIKENKFIVFLRTTEADSEFYGFVDKYRSEGADITVADMPKFDVSSTVIRKKLAQGKYDGLPVDEKVLNYIIKNRLYGE